MSGIKVEILDESGQTTITIHQGLSYFEPTAHEHIFWKTEVEYFQKLVSPSGPEGAVGLPPR